LNCDRIRAALSGSYALWRWKGAVSLLSGTNAKEISFFQSISQTLLPSPKRRDRNLSALHSAYPAGDSSIALLRNNSSELSSLLQRLW
jgi:hypothetical protein